jgi:O-antigen/teichoic acid export membrane protein
MLTVRPNVFVNSFWNVTGDFAPMLLAFVAIPVVIRQLGVAEFGVLSIAWAVVAYMAILDLGLSRALTKLVTDQLSTDSAANVSALFWGCNLLTALFGMLGGAALFIATPHLLLLLNIPLPLRGTTTAVFRLLALAVPVVISSSALQGFIAAFQRFDLITAVRVPASATVFLCPLIVLAFSRSLAVIVLLLLVTRLMAGAAYFWCCLYVWPSLLSEFQSGREQWRRLLNFGGWVMVTNSVVPVMMYCDRFFVSALLSLSAVTFYVTPYEAVAKLTIIPSAIARAFFPAFTEGFALSTERAATLLKRGTSLVLLVSAPVVATLAILAPLGLGLWLGPAFAAKSATVLRWLAVGVLFNATAHLPYTLIQAAHRPDLPAKLNAIEIPFFLVAEYCLIKQWGIAGAAVAWSARLVVDTIGLWMIVDWVLPGSRAAALRAALSIGAVLVMILMGIWLPLGVSGQIAFVSATLLIGLPAGWSLLFSREERVVINQWGMRLLARVQPG